MKPALFIDRDGTLNKDCPYCKNESEIVMYDDVFDTIEKLSDDYYIIIVTNQSGIGRGYFTVADLTAMNNKVKKEIEEHGGRIDGIYYCPHKPDEGCDCRKPKLGLLSQAQKDFDISMEGSFIIGDDDSDMEMARSAGVRGIRVRRHGNIEGDFFAEDFYDVLDIVNKNAGDLFHGVDE